MTSTPDSGQRWPGRSPIPRQVRVPQDQGGAQDRRIGEGGPQDHGGGRARGACAKRRRYSSYEGETTPAPANLVDRDFTAERPNEKWLTDISEIKARDGKVYLSPMIDCFDGKIVAYTAGFSPNAELANRMLEKAASTLPGNARPWCIPTVDAITGGPDGSGSWNASG